MECVFLIHLHMCVLSQSYPTVCDPMDWSPSGSSVHGISQARIPEWVAISSPRGSSWLRDQTCVSCICCTGMRILYHWATRETLIQCVLLAEMLRSGPCTQFILRQKLHLEIDLWLFVSIFDYLCEILKWESLRVVTAAMKWQDVCFLAGKLWQTSTVCWKEETLLCHQRFI